MRNFSVHAKVLLILGQSKARVDKQGNVSMKGLHDHPRSNPEERVIRAEIRENLRQKARELSISIITYKDQIQKSLFVHQKRLMESLTSSAPLDNVGYRENCISKVRSAGNMFASHYSKTP